MSVNFREWSNPRNHDDDEEWSKAMDLLFGDWRSQPRPLYADEETIDLMMDHLERQFPVEFDESDKQFLHSVGMTP